MNYAYYSGLYRNKSIAQTLAISVEICEMMRHNLTVDSVQLLLIGKVDRHGDIVTLKAVCTREIEIVSYALVLNLLSAKLPSIVNDPAVLFMQATYCTSCTSFFSSLVVSNLYKKAS